MISDEIIKKIAKKYRYHQYMIRRYFDLFSTKEEVLDFLNANEKGVPKAIRINTLKIDEENIIKRLEKRKIKLEKINWTKYGYYVVESENVPIGATPEYLLGYYFIQTAASMIPPEVLNPNKDDLVIDMCAAPGAKTTQIAQLMGNKGKIIAIDSSSERIKALIANIQRLGVKNVVTFVMDSSKLFTLNIKADKILLDAPCTGEGLIPIEPKRKKSRSIRDILIMSRIQTQLLESAVRSLKKGGTIVYSTCSVAPEENELVITRVMKKFENIHLEKINLNVGSPGIIKFGNLKFNTELNKARRLYPHNDGTIGFFIAKLKVE
ncbi:MAG: NOL1/NOP2/sun family putative RNA methylase [Candidatus Asgardarchaeia archaeon]